jgi:hypothetical protein
VDHLMWRRRIGLVLINAHFVSYRWIVGEPEVHIIVVNRR